MPVTELALLRVLSSSDQGKTELSSDLLDHLRLAKEAMKKVTGFKFDYLHCIEDPGHIFIIGGWLSIQFHMEEWIPSAENQELLKLMKDEVDVEWMFHLDLYPNDKESLLRRKVVAVGRYVVKEGAKDDFMTVFGELKGKLELIVRGEDMVKAGWRIDRGYMKGDEYAGEKEYEEFVSFTGWESVEEHLDIGKMEEFQKTSKIREYMKEGGSKHGVLLDV